MVRPNIDQRTAPAVMHDMPSRMETFVASVHVALLARLGRGFPRGDVISGHVARLWWGGAGRDAGPDLSLEKCLHSSFPSVAGSEPSEPDPGYGEARRAREQLLRTWMEELDSIDLTVRERRRSQAETSMSSHSARRCIQAERESRRVAVGVSR